MRLEALTKIAEYGLPKDLQHSEPTPKGNNTEDLLKQYEELLKEETGMNFKIMRGAGPAENFSEEEMQKIREAEEIIQKHRTDEPLKIH